MDVYDRLQPADMMKNAVIVASFVLPRGQPRGDAAAKAAAEGGTAGGTDAAARSDELDYGLRTSDYRRRDTCDCRAEVCSP